jgi:hypothetical protein
MSIHDAVTADFDGKDGGKISQPIYNPYLAVREVPACNCIITAEIPSADTPADAVVNPDFAF